MESVVFPETYRNCCRIPHWICSIIICVIFFIVSIIGFILSIACPGVVENNMYKVGATFEQIRYAGGISSIILILTCTLLAYGIAHDWAVALLSWIIVGILLWKVHLVLFVCSFVYVLIRVEGPVKNDWFRLFALIIFQVLWLILIIMIGRHWYAICEEIYANEFATSRGRSIRSGHSRAMLMSNRSRISYAQRIKHNAPKVDTYIYNRPVPVI